MLTIRTQSFSSRLSSRKGLSLLELTFATVVIAMIVLFSVSQYNRYATNKNLELVSYNVDQIFQAAAQYYWTNRTTFSVTAGKSEKNDIKTAGLWPTSLLLKGNKITPSDSNYDISFASIAGIPVTDRVVVNVIVDITAALPYAGLYDAILLNWYKGKLGATSISSTVDQLTWSRTITSAAPTANPNLWINDTQLQQFRGIVTPPGSS